MASRQERPINPSAEHPSLPEYTMASRQEGPGRQERPRTLERPGRQDGHGPGRQERSGRQEGPGRQEGQGRQDGPVNPTTEQLGKLRSELDIVESNAQVLSEMLTELQPGKELQDDFLLLQELYATCREMQKRIQELLCRIANEEVIGVLLRVNDNLNSVFIRYERYDRTREEIIAQRNTEDIVPPPISEIPVESRPSDLIEFTKEEPKSLPKVDSQDLEDEFAEFAQSRTIAKFPERITGSTYEDNIKGVPNEGSIADVMRARGPYPDPPKGTTNTEENTSFEDDIEDVEQWLQNTDLSQLEAEERNAREESLRATRPPPYVVQTSETAQPMTSSEFDKFLSDRAMIGSQSLNSSSPLSPPQQLVSPPRPRTLQMVNVIAGDKTAEDM